MKPQFVRIWTVVPATIEILLFCNFIEPFMISYLAPLFFFAFFYRIEKKQKPEPNIQ